VNNLNSDIPRNDTVPRRFLAHASFAQRASRERKQRALGMSSILMKVPGFSGKDAVQPCAYIALYFRKG
jgi:hypothetical protein